MMVHDFVARLKKYGLEWFGLYYGEYHGEVVEVMDGEPNDHLNRIKVRAPEVWPDDFADEDLPWAWPSYGPGGVKHGLVWTPKVGDAVSVRFHLGRRRAPKYTTTWWGKGEAPDELGLDRRGFVTPNGWVMVWDDDADTFEINSPDDNITFLIDNANNSLIAMGPQWGISADGLGNVELLGGLSYMRLNADGTVALGGNDDLVQVVSAIADALVAMTIPTAAGPQPPVNLPSFIQTQLRMNTIKE